MTFREMHNQVSGSVIKNAKVAKKDGDIMRPGPRTKRDSFWAAFDDPPPSLSKDDTRMRSEKEPEPGMIPKLQENSSDTDSEPGIFAGLPEKFPPFSLLDEDLSITEPSPPTSKNTIEYDSTRESERNRAKSALLTFFSSPSNKRGKLRITKRGAGLQIRKYCWCEESSGIKLHIDTVDDIMEKFFSVSNQYDTLMIARGANQSQGIRIELQDSKKSEPAEDCVAWISQDWD
ncbi:hypothetical protein EAE96_005219 [Botrytis aclada]|nr:hypothetical protein EAE96_005219 [Botrytis aclada]